MPANEGRENEHGCQAAENASGYNTPLCSTESHGQSQADAVRPGAPARRFSDGAPHRQGGRTRQIPVGNACSDPASAHRWTFRRVWSTSLSHLGGLAARQFVPVIRVLGERLHIPRLSSWWNNTRSG